MQINLAMMSRNVPVTIQDHFSSPSWTEENGEIDFLKRNK